MQFSQHNGPSQGGSDVSGDSMSSGIEIRDNLLLPRSSLPKDDAQKPAASHNRQPPVNQRPGRVLKYKLYNYARFAYNDITRHGVICQGLLSGKRHQFC